jgi:hypothetical protein
MNEKLSIKMKKGSQEPGASTRLPAKALVRQSLLSAVASAKEDGGGGSATVGAVLCPGHLSLITHHLVFAVGDIFSLAIPAR